MADGLVIKHPTTGAVIFNTATITGHSRASFNTSSSAGSLSVAALLRGTPFIIQALPTDASASYNVPDFQINGSTISWNAAARNMRVLAGSRAVGGPGASATFDGFMVRRPDGSLQVSTADQALQLATFGALVLQDDGGTHPQPIVIGSVTIAGVNPVLAFRGQTDAEINIYRIVSSGGNWTFYFRCRSSTAVGLIYWIFDATGQALMLGTDVGLVMKDSTGVKTFDSRAWALNIVDHVVVEGAFTQSRSASGRSYAAIQSSLGYIQSQEDLGGYSSSENPPNEAQLGEPQDPRPLGTAWAYMRGQAWHSTARATSDGGLIIGATAFENYSGWYANSILPSDSAFGTTRHSIVDVTGLPSATMPTPGSVSVSVSASLREVTVSASSPASTISPVVTASASGGTAPYAYEWYRREGGGGVGAYGPTDQASFRTQTANQPPGSTYEETWGCRVTDAVGVVGYSPDVVFRHIVQAIDLTPDAISYANVATVTNDAIGFAGVASKQITGVSQVITLRLERFNYAGTADVGYLLGYKGPSAIGPWTQVVSLNPLGTATQFGDFTIANGEWFYFYGQAETTSGRKTAAFDVVVWNESAGHIVLASTNLSMVVDDNNDFNVADYAPDAVNWGNLSIYTNDASGGSSAAFGQITSINRDITLRVAISNRSGSISSASLGVHINPVGASSSGGPWTHYSLNANANSSQDFTLSNGRWIYFDAAASTSSGRKDHSYTVTITNVTTGAVIDTFTVSTTVDADNDFNVADYDLDAIDWGNIFFDSSAGSYYTTNAYRTMSGINANVSLSVVVSDFFVTGGAIQNSLWAMQSATRGDLILANLGNGSYGATIQPSEQIRFGINIATTGGRREFGFNVYVYNATTGAFIDHFSMSGYVG